MFLYFIFNDQNILKYLNTSLMEKYLQPLTLFANIFLCNKIRTKISKQVLGHQKIPIRAYLLFVIFSVSLLLFNLSIHMYFQKPNLYQQLLCPRYYSLSQVKEHGDNMKVKIMSMQYMSMHDRMANIRKLEEIVNVLSHPARRLSYDSFGMSETEFAWAFMSQGFLMQMVVQSAVFYIVCTFMSMVNTKKSQLKEILKIQIFVMILLFLWEIDIIMSTQSRLHTNYTDFLDNIFFAFPMFERRLMIKSLLIPTMNMVTIFIKFFIKGSSFKKIQLLGNNRNLRMITNPIAENIQKINRNDKDFETKTMGSIAAAINKYKLAGQIYQTNRKIVGNLLYLNMQNILPNPQIQRINEYFKLPFIFITN